MRGQDSTWSGGLLMHVRSFALARHAHPVGLGVPPSAEPITGKSVHSRQDKQRHIFRCIKSILTCGENCVEGGLLERKSSQPVEDGQFLLQLRTDLSVHKTESTHAQRGEMDVNTDGAFKHWGAVVQQDGSTTFRVWAPACASLILELNEDGAARSVPMQPANDGFFQIDVAECADGTRYRFRLPNGNARPDPASRYQPEGVHGWSQVVDSRKHQWRDATWRGIPKQELIIYELHVGCFSQSGTYRGARDRLDELVDLGVTAIELMPIADSPGRWNWGYDGVNLFAPRHTFGTPDELRELIDAAHQRELAVLLDVVYNHFGPEGNYWGDFGPYLSARHSTPWGSAPNFDEEQSAIVRDFIIANALYWIEEFHFDGLRVDALHCMADDSDPHIVRELGDAVAGLRASAARELHLIAESNIYDSEVIRSVEHGGHGWDALWCDDFLHSMFAILRPGDHMSSRQYLPHADLDATLRRGFVFHGTVREQRRRLSLDETEGSPRVSIDSLVYAIQNHDFIGNHPQGRRLHQLSSADAQQAAAALLLLLPAIPMLFMGEEFASDSPFYFFVDFGDAHLREAVEQGRRAEHPQHDWTDVASPLSNEAFERSKVGTASTGSADMRDWYQSLIALRKQWQRDGILSHVTMKGNWNEPGHFAHVAYQDHDQPWFVIVRLHPFGEFPRRIRLAGDIDLLMSQSCEQAGTDWILGAHGVAIGRGRLPSPWIERDGFTRIVLLPAAGAGTSWSLTDRTACLSPRASFVRTGSE